MPFVDREIEMSALEAAYKNPIASLFVVYGRRRVLQRQTRIVLFGH